MDKTITEKTDTPAEAINKLKGYIRVLRAGGGNVPATSTRWGAIRDTEYEIDKLARQLTKYGNVWPFAKKAAA
jgi:hypothetical protein